MKGIPSEEMTYRLTRRIAQHTSEIGNNALAVFFGSPEYAAAWQAFHRATDDQEMREKAREVYNVAKALLKRESE